MSVLTRVAGPDRRTGSVPDALKLPERRAKMKICAEALRRVGTIRTAVVAANVSRRSFHRWFDESKQDPDNENFQIDMEDGLGLRPFNEVCADAWEYFADHVEEELFRRAVDGVVEDVFGVVETRDEHGKITRSTGIVGKKKVFSDRLLEIAIRAVRPAKFSPTARVEHEHAGVVEITDSSRAKLLEKILAAKERLAVEGEIVKPAELPPPAEERGE